jgi:hypothetical protein
MKVRNVIWIQILFFMESRVYGFLVRNRERMRDQYYETYS